VSPVRPVPGPPDYTEHQGRRVVWGGWRTLRVMCLPPRPCAQCGSTAEAWLADGVVHPLPGEVVRTTRLHHSRRAHGRTWETPAKVPARPYRALSASCCTRCGQIDIYEVGDRP